MSAKSVGHKPSETALLAALRRTLAHRQFNNQAFGPDELAEYFLPPHVRFLLRFKPIQRKIKHKLDRFLPGLQKYIIARTCFFDRLFLEALNNKMPQIVLLGAGYDSRAYRFSGLNTNTCIFELDHAATQDRKKKCLRRAHIAVPTQLTFVPIDFDQDSLADALSKAGYRKNLETLFLWEGVSYYLGEESVSDTLTVVSQQSHCESQIAFDYMASVSEANWEDYYGVKEFFQIMETHHGDERLRFSLNEGDIEAFLKQADLNKVSHMDNKEIEQEFLLEEDKSLLGHVTGHFRFVVASPYNSTLRH